MKPKSLSVCPRPILAHNTTGTFVERIWAKLQSKLQNRLQNRGGPDSHESKGITPFFVRRMIVNWLENLTDQIR